MLNGITEEHQVHADDTWCAVVFLQHVLHELLQSSSVSDVLIHVVHMDVVTCGEGRITTVINSFVPDAHDIVSCLGVWGFSFVGYHLIVVFFWNEISDKLAKQGAMKNMSENISYNNLLLLSHEIASVLEKTVYKKLEKSKSAIPSCSMYLARVICKFHLNSWNTKYLQTVTCVRKNILSVNHIMSYYKSRFRKKWA